MILPAPEQREVLNNANMRNGEHTIVILTLNVYKLSVEITKVINHPLGFMTLIQETLLLSTKMNQDLSATLILIVMPHKYFAEIYTMTPLWYP